MSDGENAVKRAAHLATPSRNGCNISPIVAMLPSLLNPAGCRRMIHRRPGADQRQQRAAADDRRRRAGGRVTAVGSETAAPMSQPAFHTGVVGSASAAGCYNGASRFSWKWRCSMSLFDFIIQLIRAILELIFFFV